MVRSDAVLTDCDARQFSSAALPPTAGFELRTPPVGSIIVVLVFAARPLSPNRQCAFTMVYDMPRKPLASTTRESNLFINLPLYPFYIYIRKSSLRYIDVLNRGLFRKPQLRPPQSSFHPTCPVQPCGPPQAHATASAIAHLHHALANASPKAASHPRITKGIEQVYDPEDSHCSHSDFGQLWFADSKSTSTVVCILPTAIAVTHPMPSK
jgi:hypothetical protein